MILVKTEKTIIPFLQKWRKNQLSIGFVPTMGALHNGHLSLISSSISDCDICVSSLFVNPTQFNNKSDFEKYPVTLEKDIALLEAAGCHILFLPSVSEIYPPNYVPPHYPLGELEMILEGKYRPGHFQGVCQVVDRLLHIIHPQCLYLGQKDYQQCMVIKKMIELRNYFTDVKINPTIRDANGLALSSRNMRLSDEEKILALHLSKTLFYIKENIEPGNVELLKQQMAQQLEDKGFKVDYVEIASAATLETVTHWNGNDKLVALVAAYINEVRLIDNMLLF